MPQHESKVELYADVIRVMKAPMYFQDDDVTSRDPVVGIDAAVEDVLERLDDSGYLEAVRRHDRAAGLAHALNLAAEMGNRDGLGRRAKAERTTALEAERDAFVSGVQVERRVSDDVTRLLLLIELRRRYTSGELLVDPSERGV